MTKMVKKIVKKICFYIGDRIIKFGYWFLRVTGNMEIIYLDPN